MIFQSPSMSPVETASDSITIDAWIMVVLTALTFLFALWSYWSANKSKKARQAAEKAEANADRRVRAAESTASELRKVVEQLSLPPLVATASKPKYSTIIMLRNTTDAPVTVIEVLNAAKFFRLDLETTAPFTIEPGAQYQLIAHAANGYPVPSNLHFQISSNGQRRDVHVPIPRVN